MTTSRPLTVLMSFPRPRATTNPYIVQLHDALTGLPDVQVLPFSYRAAFTRRVDLFHAHWPESLISGRSRPKDAVRQVLYLLLLARLALTRSPIVRTLHNIGLPTGLSRTQRLLLRLTERRTRAVIVLNPLTPVRPGLPVARIAHGHYRDWFAPFPRPATVPGRITYAGWVRRYKGVDDLVAAFVATEDSDLSLRVCGQPSSVELGTGLQSLAAADPRVELCLRHLDDGELVAELAAAELVVLPYRFMHNSGASLAALSVGTPVLVPDNPVNRLLAAEVGAGWVHLFDDTLTPQTLTSTLAAVRAAPPGAAPDLSARSWEGAGDAHRRLYRVALGRPAQPGGEP